MTGPVAPPPVLPPDGVNPFRLVLEFDPNMGSIGVEGAAIDNGAVLGAMLMGAMTVHIARFIEARTQAAARRIAVVPAGAVPPFPGKIG